MIIKYHGMTHNHSGDDTTVLLMKEIRLILFSLAICVQFLTFLTNASMKLEVSFKFKR